jgi:AcrR family transcriptional regulator
MRQALLEAGREVFAERGYGSAAARDIVARAGATAPVLYHHFGSKAGLFAAVLKDVNDRVISAFEDAIADGDDLVERIDAILDAVAKFGVVAPSLGRFVVAAPLEFGRHPELSIAASEMTRLSKFVHRMCDVSEASGVPRDQAEGLVLTLIYGLSRMAASPGTSRRASKHVATAVSAFKPLLRGQFFPADKT